MYISILTFVTFGLFPFLSKSSLLFDQRLEGHVFERSNVIGVQMCARYCATKPECHSINYDKNDLLCELNDVTIAGQFNLSTEIGFRYIEPEEIIQDQSDVCLTNNPCPAGTTCTRLTRSGHTCMITECLDDPPDLSVASIVVIGRSVGQILNYTCDNGYSGPETAITCSAGGQWIPQHPACAPPNDVLNCLSSSTCWVKYAFTYDNSANACSGDQFVKRTSFNNGILVGAILCPNYSGRYKLFLSDDIDAQFLNIGDALGHGEDQCELVGGNTSSAVLPSDYIGSPHTTGYYRSNEGQDFKHGLIGYPDSLNLYGAWYECGVDIPGNHHVVVRQ